MRYTFYLLTCLLGAFIHALLSRA